jgi:trehalose 6-phosphate synthase/phosphatase
MEASFALLQFRVRYTPLRPGESICAVGEHPSLGCWDPAHSLKLRKLREDPGVWVSLAPVSVPSGVSIQYKYLLFHEGRFDRWEAFDGNRSISASSGVRVGGRLRPAADEFDVLAPSAAAGARACAAGATLGGGSEADGTTGVSGPPAAYEAGVTEGGSILVVAYILPLLITREAETAGWVIEWNLDSVLARRASAGRAEGKKVVWIGCPGVPVAPADRQSLTEALAHFSAIPVYLEPKMHEEFYAGFCRSFLWPTFHNVIKAGAYSHSAWRAYCAVNRTFADAVVEV